MTKTNLKGIPIYPNSKLREPLILTPLELQKVLYRVSQTGKRYLHRKAQLMTTLHLRIGNPVVGLSYVVFDFEENTFEVDGKTPITKDIIVKEVE